MTASLMRLWLSLEKVDPEVTLGDISESNFRNNANCTQNFKIATTGDFTASDNVGGYGSPDGTWLTAGAANDVWAELSISGDTLDTDTTGGGRQQLDVDLEFGYLRTTTGVDTGVITVDFYDAASGGSLLDTADITLTAERTSGA